jgi:hypothetical protein
MRRIFATAAAVLLLGCSSTTTDIVGGGVLEAASTDNLDLYLVAMEARIAAIEARQQDAAGNFVNLNQLQDTSGGQLDRLEALEAEVGERESDRNRLSDKGTWTAR